MRNIQFDGDRCIKIIDIENEPFFPLELEIYTTFIHPHLVHGSIATEECMKSHKIGISMPRALGDLYRFDVVNPLVVIKAIANAVVCLHRHHILHLDIKSTNILVYSPEDIRLTDFGSATYMSANNQYVSSCGMITYPWRPPENLAGDNVYTVKSDVWSLGMVLLGLLDPAWNYPPENEFLAYLDTRLQPVKWAGYQQLLGGMLDRNPKTRFTMEQVVQIVGEVVVPNSRIVKNWPLPVRVFTEDECKETFRALLSMQSQCITPVKIIHRAILAARLYVKDEEIAFACYALCILYDNVTGSKIFDSAFFIDALAKQWLHKDLPTKTQVRNYLNHTCVDLIERCHGLTNIDLPNLLDYYPGMIKVITSD